MARANLRGPPVPGIGRAAWFPGRGYDVRGMG